MADSKKRQRERDPDGLSLLQRNFVENYALTENQVQSYIDAGYQPGRSAAGSASKLLTTHKIQSALLKLLLVRQQRFKATAEGVIQKLCAYADNDITVVMDENNRMKPFDQWPASYRQSLTELNFDKDTGAIVKVKTVDKLASLGLIAKHLGMLVDKKEIMHLNGDDLVKRLQDGRDRLADHRELLEIEAAEVIENGNDSS